MLPVETAFKIYSDLNGEPLDDGYIYFGQADQNPITAPVTVYWDEAGTQPAAQPLRTVNGYIVRAGTPANVFYSTSYSLLVLDSARQQVYYAQNSDKYSLAAAIAALQAFVISLASSIGSTLVGFIQAGTGAILRTVQSKLRDTVSVLDYGADPTGVADSTAAFQAAVNYSNVYVPTGNYRITSTILVPSNRKITGNGYGSRLFADGTFVPTNMAWAGGPLPVMFGNAGIVSSSANANIEIDGIYSDWSTGPGQVHHVHMRNTTGCRVRNCYFRKGADATAFTMSSDYQVTGNTAWDTANCAYDQWENSHDGLVANNIAYIAFGYGMLATGDTSLNTPGTTYAIHFVNNEIHGDGTSNSGIGLWLQSGSNATSVCHSCVAIGNRFIGFDVIIRSTGGGKHIIHGNRGYSGRVAGISLSAEVAGFGSSANSIVGNVLEICGNASGAPIHIQDNSSRNIITNNESINHNGALYACIIEATALVNTVRNNILDTGTTGIFNDASGANNTDEIKSFTPTLISSGGGTPTYGTVYGNARKINGRVFYNLRINLTAVGTLGAGNLTIGGLPWTSMGDSSDNINPAAATFTNLQAAITVPPLARVAANVAVVELLKFAAGSTSNLTVADIGATTSIAVSGSYQYK